MLTPAYRITVSTTFETCFMNATRHRYGPVVANAITKREVANAKIF